MCLYGFVFALYLSLFVGEELAPPVAPNTAIPHNHCKRTTTPRSAQCPCLARSSRCTEPFHSRNHCKRTTTPLPAQTLLPYERSVGFASLRNSGRSTSGIHARPLSKVRCCRQKKLGRLPEGLSLHQPFQHRTITLAFRRASVCVCLYGFVFALYLSLFVGEELAPPVAPNTAIPHNHCKRTTTPRSSPTLPKPHYPLLCTITLASLVKGEVLSPEKIRATTGGIVTPPTLPKPHYPLLCTITLASLVKGRWIDGKAQALILLRSVCDTPTFFYLSNFSAVKTEGLPHHYSSPLTNPSKTALSLALHHHTCLPCQREVD